MCGVTGWIGLAPRADDRQILAELTGALAHRGPDGEGAYFAPEAGLALGHRRLAILDLTAASAQPMIDAASGVALSYNGELFNFRDLKNELEARGHTFHSSGDVEVLLRSFLEWREACFEKLAGMFALALWDPRERALWLARDALGIKPLFYCRLPSGGVVFSSEARALARRPEVELRVRRSGLACYLEFGFQLGERESIFAGVEKLGPGEVLRLTPEGGSRRSWHFVPASPAVAQPRPVEERIDRLDETLRRVVAEHLVADVPVGVLLSGGLDSSLVTALAARSGPPTTVSMGFAESDHDERAWAARAAAHVGSHHHEVLLRPAEVLAELDTCAGTFDDLFADFGTVTTRMLYRRCRDLGLKVILVGEGADELFGGYPTFEEAARPASELSTFRLYRRYASRRWGAGYPRFRRVLREHLARSGGDLFHAVRLFETRNQMPGNYVMKVDRASMSVSVEARAPFLDRRVAELALATPREQLLREGTNKWLLRQVARREGMLPEATADRPKVGGSIAASWMSDSPELRRVARERVLRRKGWAAALGLRPAMLRYFDGRGGYPPPHPLSLLEHLAWRLLLLESWAAALGLRAEAIADG